MLNKKWNISILVIFVLLASSLLGVLSMNFIQSMMKQSATTYNYYQSYYLAKAGVELGLTELGHRGVGFEQTFADSGFVQKNFLCGKRCDLTFALSWTSSYLSQQFRTDTTCKFPFVLSGGGSLIIPVFKDIFSWSLSDGFSQKISYQNLYKELRKANIIPSADSPVTFGMVVLSWEELASDGIFFQSGSLDGWLQSFLTAFDTQFREPQGISSLDRRDISPYRFFFMISNPSDKDISFCVNVPWALPTQQYYLQSQWTYDSQKLWLEAIYKQPIPDFLLNGYLSF